MGLLCAPARFFRRRLGKPVLHTVLVCPNERSDPPKPCFSRLACRAIPRNHRVFSATGLVYRKPRNRAVENQAVYGRLTLGRPRLLLFFGLGLSKTDPVMDQQRSGRKALFRQGVVLKHGRKKAPNNGPAGPEQMFRRFVRGPPLDPTALQTTPKSLFGNRAH
jgi:hypothetical protein